MSADVLNDCPWCGADAEIEDNGESQFWVCCTSSSCLAEGPVRSSRDAAADAWNNPRWETPA